MLVVSTIDDENVPYNNGVRYVTKVRDMIKTKNESKSVYPTEDEMDNDILLHIEKEGGHHLHGRKLDVCTLEACFLLGNIESIEAFFLMIHRYRSLRLNCGTLR